MNNNKKFIRNLNTMKKEEDAVVGAAADVAIQARKLSHARRVPVKKDPILKCMGILSTFPAGGHQKSIGTG